MECEELELLAELAVIALLRFLELLEVRAQRFGRRKRGPVDALEHRVALVAPPVCACHARELHRLQETRRWNVRPFAKVDPLSVPVERDGILEALEVFELESLVERLQDSAGFVPAHDLAAEGAVGFHDLDHLFFDGAEVLFGEGAVGASVVVVEAVVGGRTEGHLGPWEQTLHRVRHDVGARMPDDRQRVGIVCADRLHLGRPLGDGGVQVVDLAINPDRYRVFP